MPQGVLSSTSQGNLTKCINIALTFWNKQVQPNNHAQCQLQLVHCYCKCRLFILGQHVHICIMTLNQQKTTSIKLNSYESLSSFNYAY